MIKTGYEPKTEGYHRVAPAATTPYSSADEVKERIAILKAAGEKPAYRAEIRSLENGLKLTGGSLSGLESKLKAGVNKFNKVLAEFHEAYDAWIADYKAERKAPGGHYPYKSPEAINHNELFRREERLGEQVVKSFETEIIPILALMGKVKYTDGSSYDRRGRVTSTDSSITFEKIQRAAGAKGEKIVKAWEVY